jgi:cytochrome b561
MSMKIRFPRHHNLTIALHWTTFGIIIFAVCAVLLRDVVEASEVRLLLLNLHRSFGVVILLLVVARLIARFRISSEHVSASLPKGIRLLSLAAHTVLYLFLLALPVTGWLFSNAAGKAVSLFGLVNLPELIAKNRDLADQLGDVHETLAWLFIALIGAHVGAALWHHFWRKDDVLRSMLPVRLLRTPAPINKG